MVKYHITFLKGGQPQEQIELTNDKYAAVTTSALIKAGQVIHVAKYKDGKFDDSFVVLDWLEIHCPAK